MKFLIFSDKQRTAKVTAFGRGVSKQAEVDFRAFSGFHALRSLRVTSLQFPPCQSALASKRWGLWPQ